MNKRTMNERITTNGISAAAVGLLVIGCGAPPSDDTPEIAAVNAALSSKCPPEVDASIAVPSGHRLAFELDALGLQIYVCQATGTGFAWTLQAPDATLYNGRGKAVGTHYAGPTWQYKDGSSVVATKVASFTPDTTTIPWLLLQATSHAGKGKMDDVTFVQRLYTEGGLAPDVSTCTADTVGEFAPVEYVATYYYFEAGKPPCGCK